MFGGGMVVRGVATLTRVFVTGNTAQGDGGGLNNTGTLTVIDSEISQGRGCSEPAGHCQARAHHRDREHVDRP